MINASERQIIFDFPFGKLVITTADKNGDIEFEIPDYSGDFISCWIPKTEIHYLIEWLQKELAKQ